MVRDLMPELLQGAGRPLAGDGGESGGAPHAAWPTPPRAAAAGGRPAAGGGHDVLKEAAVLRAEASALRGRLSELRSTHVRATQAVSEEAASSARQDLVGRSTEVVGEAAALQRRIASLRRRAAALPPGSGSSRQLHTILSGLEQGLRDTLAQLDALRVEVREEHASTLRRRIFVVTGAEPREEELRAALAGGKGPGGAAAAEASEGVFRLALRGEAREALMGELLQRQASVTEVERGLEDLHGALVELAAMVDTQGETVETIEHQVEQSHAYTSSAARALGEAREYQRASRKKACWAVTAVAVAAGLVALVVVLGIALV